jgi:uncharacterized repeat protein (TIGR03803 family)
MGSRLVVIAVGCVIALPLPAMAAGVKEKVLYSFASDTDGANPEASLIAVNGKLYGTTYGGALDSCGFVCGTVFSFDPKTGRETVLHSFAGYPNDGTTPQASLIEFNGLLYSTTTIGGTSDVGTVFSIDPATGSVNILHSFGTDGQYPQATLLAFKGKLYGATSNGGANGSGTVFAIDPSTGKETILHAFGSGADGEDPYAGLIAVKHTLYGTTQRGGDYGPGAVFSIDATTGAESVVHSFGNGPDGMNPYGSLIDVNGTLYGTTWLGGKGCWHDRCGNGTVFSLDLATGAEKSLYSFCSQKKCPDGGLPYAGLASVGGILYGTTVYGGAQSKDCGNVGCGTVFSIDPSTGAETVVYAFKGGTDGHYPYGGMIAVKGTLYGTTEEGGSFGHGTLFAIKGF